MNLDEKRSNLTKLIKSYKKVAVAFSGGVDSSFLAKVTFDALAGKSLALTVDTMFISRSEEKEAKEIAAQIGIRHKIIRVPDLSEDILNNDRQRCYYCKKSVFSLLLKEAEAEGIQILVDGSNVDDLSDYRPGMKALKELEVKSPLVECGFSKDNIRTASEQLGLSTWQKPSLACLASRVPYDQKITREKLSIIEKAETYLRSLGLQQFRVRFHQELARIEVAPSERALFFQTKFMDDVANTLKSFGFKYVALDLEGYVTGKMN